MVVQHPCVAAQMIVSNLGTGWARGDLLEPPGWLGRRQVWFTAPSADQLLDFGSRRLRGSVGARAGGLALLLTARCLGLSPGHGAL